MTKKQILSRFNNLKYYDGQLNAVEKEVAKIGEFNFRAQKRFIKETELVTELYMCHIYNSLPTTLDIIENPKQIITKQDAYKTIIVEREGVVARSGYNFCYIPEEKFKILLEVYKELNKA
jgi:hypothetical protein